MDYLEIIKKAEKFAKPFYKRYDLDTKIWENHIQLVRKYALRLAELEGADK
jgi:hypothetical protein